MKVPEFGDLVRITTNISTSHYGETGQVNGVRTSAVSVEFANGQRQVFGFSEVEVVATLDGFVVFNKAHLPKVTRSGNSVVTELDDSGVSWSFGVDPEEAPDETDPLHFIAVIDYFKRNGLPLHSGDTDG